MENLKDYIEANKKRYLDELFELLRIPSISAQAEHTQDVRKTAEWLRSHLENIGLENSKIMETKGHPVVYADYIKDSSKPTVLVYGHYDVQSPDPLEEWESEPFEPTIRNGNIYARGVADDKSQLFTHIKALEAIMKTSGQLPVNVKFLFEGEEEVGSENLDEFIKEKIELLRADVCLISDSNALSETLPMMEYGLRGIVYMQLNLSVMPKDVHSGAYGGNVPNADFELVTILSKLKNSETQEVLIPKFYENVRNVDDKEKQELKHSMITDKTILDETGAKEIIGVKGFSAIEREGTLPTLDINGMHGGYTGDGPKTIIPAKSSAKISMRLVPNQTVAEITEKFVSYVKSVTPSYVDLEIKSLSSGEPLLMGKENEFFKRAEDAFQESFGNKPVYELQGGSIPITATLKTLLGIDSILMGFGLPDDGLHSPNEKMSVSMFYKGIETSLLFFQGFEK